MRLFLQPARFRKRWDVAGQPLSDLTPLNAAARAAAAAGGRVADLDPHDHLVVQSSSRAFLPFLGVRARISCMMLEPSFVQPRHYRAMPFLSGKFFAVLTYDRRLLSACRNAVSFNAHRAWATPSDAAKSKRVSLIASAKRDLEGHRLRLRLAERHRGRLDLFGRAFRPVDSKNEALDPYRFSVVVENCRVAGYFTEKIIDCFLTKTVPIYWGDPCIGDHFDATGVIACATEEEMDNAIETADEEVYRARAQAADTNFRRALDYVDMPARLGRVMADAVEARGPG